MDWNMVYRFRSVSNSFLVSCFNVHGWFEKIADRLQQKKENYDREEKKLLNQKTKWKNMIIRSIGEHKQSEWARPTRTTMTTRCFFLDQVTQNQNQILFLLLLSAFWTAWPFRPIYLTGIVRPHTLVLCVPFSLLSLNLALCVCFMSDHEWWLKINYYKLIIFRCLFVFFYFSLSILIRLQKPWLISQRTIGIHRI